MGSAKNFTDCIAAFAKHLRNRLAIRCARITESRRKLLAVVFLGIVANSLPRELVYVKCVICSHKFSAPLTSEMPMCPKCYGPVTVERAETKPKEIKHG